MHFGKISALLAAFPLLFAGAPPPLEPSSKWLVDYGAQRCNLVRKFGNSKSSVILRFEQTEPRGSISVFISGPRLSPGGDRRDNKLEFQPLGEVFLTQGMSVVMSEGKEEQGVYWPRGLSRGKWGLIPDDVALRMANGLPTGKQTSGAIPGYKPRPTNWKDWDWRTDDRTTLESDDRAFDERAARVETIALNPVPKRGAVILRTGSLSAPLKALEKCATDSLKDWGINAAVETTIVDRPHPATDPSGIFKASDYPSQALSAGKESRLHVWLNLDSAGHVTTCRVISTFATPEINDKMCRLVQERQKFVPARTADGTAVASYYVESFAFVLAN